MDRYRGEAGKESRNQEIMQALEKTGNRFTGEVLLAPMQVLLLKH